MVIGTLAMLCGQQAQLMESGSIVDLEKIIIEYAWRELKRDIKWYDCMKRNCFTFEVSWNFFEFDHKTTQFQLRSGGSIEGGYREKKQVELFRTDFTNNTNKDQVYKLRTQRQTKAATAVAIQKGFTLKGNTNFKLKIPPEIGHFGVSASADGYLRVCRPRGETFEDTFTWQVDSDVTVEPHHVTNARLVVTEDELVADFEVRTLMRMPTGEAPIIVRRKSNKEIYAVMMISDLRDVFSDIDCKVINIGKAETSNSTGDGNRTRPSRFAIEFITKGILESVRWRNQKISLQSCPIKDFHESPSSTDLKAGSPMYQNDSAAMCPSEMLGRMLEHVITDTEEQSRRDESSKGARAKKDLRFNIIPTVIAAEESAYESPERILNTLLRESMNIVDHQQTRTPERTRKPPHQHDQLAAVQPPEITCHSHKGGACAETTTPIIIQQKTREPTRLMASECSGNGDVGQHRPIENARTRDVTVNRTNQDEPPSYYKVSASSRDVTNTHTLQSAPPSRDTSLNLPPAQSVTNTAAPPLLQHYSQQQYGQQPQDHHYKSQVEHLYLRSGDGAVGYSPLSRDMTLIAEEPEKEHAASMSKQSSLQSEETLDDATESLDSGDSSRRVSKVTSV